MLPPAEAIETTAYGDVSLAWLGKHRQAKIRSPALKRQGGISRLLALSAESNAENQ